jgi:hypothetical protein
MQLAYIVPECWTCEVCSELSGSINVPISVAAKCKAFWQKEIFGRVLRTRPRAVVSRNDAGTVGPDVGYDSCSVEPRWETAELFVPKCQSPSSGSCVQLPQSLFTIFPKRVYCIALHTADCLTYNLRTHRISCWLFSRLSPLPLRICRPEGMRNAVRRNVMTLRDATQRRWTGIWMSSACHRWILFIEQPRTHHWTPSWVVFLKTPIRPYSEPFS